jgi:hypothetical protein
MAARDRYADAGKVRGPSREECMIEVPSALREAQTPSSVPPPWSFASRNPTDACEPEDEEGGY